MNDDIWTQLVDGIRAAFSVPGAEVTPATVASDIDGWDSVSHTYLMLSLEDLFGIRFPDERIHSLANVGELHELIGQLLAENR